MIKKSILISVLCLLLFSFATQARSLKSFNILSGNPPGINNLHYVTAFGPAEGKLYYSKAGTAVFNLYNNNSVVVSYTINRAAFLAPNITTTGTLSAFSACAGTASAEQNFQVSGTDLSDTLIITAPAGFEISLTSGGVFSSDIKLLPVSNTVVNTTIYVRLSAAATGTPSGDISCSSTGATSVNIAVTGTVSPAPSTADAGPNKTACVSPGTLTMAAVVPAVGTGAWTFINGPATPSIISTSSATTNIVGLTTVGTYTFRWTVSGAAPCASNFDEMQVVVNANPSPFTVTGGGVFCQNTPVTLTAPTDPNYTYQWSRSLSGIANPNSYADLSGEVNDTLLANAPGNYRAIVTNQFGCSVADSAAVQMGDYVFNGSLATGDAQQTGRLNRFAVVSTCASPKACPLTFTTTGARLYDSYTITNSRPVAVCATIGIASGCGTSMFSVAYSGSFNPASPCTNYLADPGSSFPTVGFYEVTIPANGTIVVVVHEVNPGTGCAAYTLSVDVPRDPASITVSPAGPYCAGTSVTLTANGIANSYLWNPGGANTAALTQTLSLVNNTFDVTYGYGNHGCTSNLDTTFSFNLPTTATAGNDTAVCGLSLSLAGNTAVFGTGTWSQIAGPGTVNFGDANSPSTTATASLNGVYTLRWTIATTGPCGSSTQDDVQVNFAATPSTADAGINKPACISPGRVQLAAVAPTSGTGVWTQVGGPVTANIISPTAPNTNITGLSTLGTYTFRWTVSNAPCASSFDEMQVVVNSNPSNFTIGGGGVTVCESDAVTLSAPADPNYTYSWGRSFLTDPFTNIGSAQTQVVNSSGIYQVVVTNAFGCTASATTIVNVADYVFNGSLATGDAVQTGRLNRFASISTCAAPKACPLTFTTTGSRLYDSYTITNPRPVPVCATIGLNSGCGTAIFSAAYSGSYNPTSLCTNYLADPGSSPATSIFYEATIPANGTIVVVVHEVNPGQGCANYSLTVDVPRDPAVITITPAAPYCAGVAVTLSAPISASYLWNPGGANTASINPTLTAGANSFDVTVGYGNNGCTSNIDTTIALNPPPTTALAGNDTATCGLTISLAANTATVGTGTWTQISGPGTVNFTDANSPVTTATASVNGVYTLRWTIATTGPCAASTQDDVNVNFAATPSTADAGINKPACISPGRVQLAAVTPTSGTGVWTQVAGPVTANIISPTAPNTNITGLNTIGTYTFRWTVSNAPCASSFDEMQVVVNSNPSNFTIGGGGVTVCESDSVTLSAPADPNYTYSWGRSFLTDPFTTIGSAQTQVVNSSGIYQVVVTNAFGCTASATTIVNVADYVFNGSLATGDAVQTGRLNRFASISTCAAPKGCPNTFTTSGSRLYDSYTITNPRPVPVCATIGLNSGCGTAIFSVAYTGSYDPNSLCTNYLADPGSSPATSIFYEATIPANGTIVVVVHEVNPGQGCANYSLTVDVPRDESPVLVSPPSVSCSGTATLTAPIANSYSWTPGGAITKSITTPPLFTTTKYYVTMNYGNTGCTKTDSATVVVTSAPPTVSCPLNISLNNTPGSCGRAVTYTTTLGGTPVPTLTYVFTGATTASGSGDGSGSFFNKGTTNVTVTATNTCGSSDCSFTVTIADNQPPTVTVGTIGSCYPTVAAAQAAALAATSAIDNCPGALTEVASTVGTCSAVITVTTTDVAGNPTAVTYNTRIDNTAPTVTVGTIGSCYPTVAAAEAAALAATSATDNCPGALTEIASTVGTCSAVVTVTTTDGCGNATAVTYNTRIDNTAPTVTVGTISSCYPTVAAAEAAALAATSATDNCPGALTEVASTVGTCSAVVTVTTTDGCGNSTAVTYNTRIDNTAPTVTVGTIGSCYPTVAAAQAAALAATSATDNCPGALIEVASTVGTCSAVVTVTTTDGCGNATAITYNTRIDNTAPTVTVGTIGSCYPTVAAAEAAALAATSATDNCPGALTEVASTVGTCSAVVTITTTDGCGNSTAVTYNTRIDNTAPTVTVGSINSCYPTVAAAEADALAATSATDNCPGALTETVSTAGTCSAVITVTTTDGCGNATAITYNTRIDNTPPSLTCPAPVTVSCSANVPPQDTSTVTNVSDNCFGGIVVSFIGDVISNQTCPDRYTITRTYRATDACGNFTECNQIITVNNQVQPTMTCPGPTTVTCSDDVPVPYIASVTNITVNCGGPATVTHIGDVISNQTCANKYTITRTYRVTDNCGNFSECTQLITVNDQIAPSLTCPAPVTVSCAGAVPAADIAAVTNVSDNCSGVVTVTHIGDVISSQTCANRYTITRTYRATDVCGNFSECTQQITVNDQTAPSMTCPAPVTVSCAGAVPAADINAVTNVTDNCGGAVTVTHEGDVISNQICANRYTISRTYRATDACGNFTECAQQITVNDQTAPTMTCPAPVTVSCASAVPAADINAVTNVTDNCGGAVTITYVGDVITSQSCLNRYTISRTYRATDACGNFSECTQQITVNDQTAPTMTCPAPVTVSCADAVPAADINAVTNVTDNCGGVVTVTHMGDIISAQTCLNRYTITRTYRATDGCGNFSECTQLITVNDQTAPTITCPAPIFVCGPAAVPAANITQVTGVSDNCNGVVTITHVGDVNNCPTCVNVPYTITRTYRATDACGNFTDCAQTITVNPIPVMTAIANQVICNLQPTATVTFGSSVSNSDFNWTNNNSLIGLANSGSGSNIPSFTASNPTQSPISGLITVTPVSPEGCIGNSTTFTITVNPTPIVNLSTFAGVCNTDPAFTLTGGTPTGGNYYVNGVLSTTFNPADHVPGVYTILYEYTNSYGCTSRKSQLITVYPQPTKPVVIPEVNNKIHSSVIENSYTWLLNSAAITGNNMVYYYPITAGYYQVVVTTQYGCSSTSDSIYYIPKRYNSAPADGQYAFVYPKPASNSHGINVHFNLPTKLPVQYVLYNTLSQLVDKGIIPAGIKDYKISLKRYQKGNYILKLEDGFKVNSVIVVPIAE